MALTNLQDERITLTDLTWLIDAALKPQFRYKGDLESCEWAARLDTSARPVPWAPRADCFEITVPERMAKDARNPRVAFHLTRNSRIVDAEPGHGLFAAHLAGKVSLGNSQEEPHLLDLPELSRWRERLLVGDDSMARRHSQGKMEVWAALYDGRVLDHGVRLCHREEYPLVSVDREHTLATFGLPETASNDMLTTLTESIEHACPVQMAIGIPPQTQGRASASRTAHSAGYTLSLPFSPMDGLSVEQEKPVYQKLAEKYVRDHAEALQSADYRALTTMGREVGSYSPRALPAYHKALKTILDIDIDAMREEWTNWMFAGECRNKTKPVLRHER